jgi:hypothetical protein
MRDSLPAKMVAEAISVGSISAEYELVVSYLWALFWNWWTLALAILAVNEVLEWQFGKSFQWLHEHRGKLAVVFIILAQALAYRDLKHSSAQTETPRQKFDVADVESRKEIEGLIKYLASANETITKLTPIKRSLTRDRHEKLVAALKDGNSYKIAIYSDPQTPETQDYSHQFESVFREAGWTIVAPVTLDRPINQNELVNLVHLRAAKGIRLLVHDVKHPPHQ